MSEKVLALYDFGGKQNFIYRTSKIKEISGASVLLTKLFGELIKKALEKYVLVNDMKNDFDIQKFNQDGTVLYDGGGNLMMLFKNEDIYKGFNRIASVYIMNNIPTLQLISCCVPFTGDFIEDKAKLYQKNRINKNRLPAYDLTAVTPFTQIDPMTFLPVVKKDKKTQESQSADRVRKTQAYEERKKELKKDIDFLDNFDGLAAVIYIDGNSMGSRLQNCNHKDYNEGVKRLRDFSSSVNSSFVLDPLKKIKEKIKETEQTGFRKVIGGGDEITIICNAKIALELTKTYFEALEESNLKESNKKNRNDKKKNEKNTACAGIAVFHSKSPFTIAYEIAEAACESAKELAHKTPGNYFDFYFCHAGITTDFETLREREQSITARPYKFDEAISKFDEYKDLLHAIGRSNVKALGDAAQLSKADYLFEAERVNAYLGNNGSLKTDPSDFEEEMKLIFDMSEFYDLWFGKEEEQCKS